MSTNGYKYKIITIVLYLLSTCVALAQQEKNNIYLFDCTGSMRKGADGGLWEPAKRALDATIRTQATAPNATFVIIPFGNKPYEAIRFNSADYASKKKEINDKFDKYINEATLTHITETLRSGIAEVDPNKENRIYLLTDGQPNGGDSSEKVADCIAKWCEKHRNTRIFYVALKENVVNPIIMEAINACHDAYVVQCHDYVIPQIGDISSEVYGNIEELRTVHRLMFSIPGSHPVTVSSTDSLFTVEIPGGKSEGCYIPLGIKSKNALSAADLHRIIQGQKNAKGDYIFTAYVTSADPDYFIANPKVTIILADHIQSRLSLCHSESEMAGKDCNHHDSFLWSKASDIDHVEFNLSPVFANVTDSEAVLHLSLIPSEGQPHDFEATFNGMPLDADNSFDVEPGRPAVLSIAFNNDALQGKRYFSLENSGYRGIDIINGIPIKDFDKLTLRSAYNIHWNPLKTWCVSVLIILLFLLLLWLLVLRKWFYPSIKIGKVEFTTPGRYFSKKIKGVRKAVLTTRSRKQGLLSRVFTGRIIYIKDEIFSPEIEIVPGTRKKIRFRSVATASERWDFMPGATFGSCSDGKATNSANHNKFEFTIN